MRQLATGRVAQAATKYAEHASTATACCNACRTCVQTNLIGLALGAALGVAAAARRLVGRPAEPGR